jgi:transposase
VTASAADKLRTQKHRHGEVTNQKRIAVPQEPDVQAQIARELVSRCRSLTRSILQLDRELEQRTAALAPALLELSGCGTLTAAKLLAEIGPIDRFNSDAQLARHSGVAPLEASSGVRARRSGGRNGSSDQPVKIAPTNSPTPRTIPPT